MGQEADAAKEVLSSSAASQDCSPQMLSKPEPSHQSLQIDCRANSSQPDIFHTFHPDAQCADREQPGPLDARKQQDALSRDSREDMNQDPTSSHESSRPAECLSPGVSHLHEKVRLSLPTAHQRP